MSYLPDAIDFAQVKRILVTKLRHHGDVLLTTPVIHAVKQQYPHIEIDLLIYADTKALVEHNPELSQIFCIDKKWRKLPLLRHLQAERTLRKQLQGRHYDLLVHLTDHWRGAKLARALKTPYSVAAKYPKRAKSFWWKKSFTHLYPLPETPRHTVETNLDALRRVGLYPRPEHKKLVLQASSQAEASVGELLQQLQLDKFWIIHPTSRWMFKSWPVEKNIELIKLLQDAGVPLIMTAAPDDRELEMIKQINAGLETRPITLAGELSLDQLTALIAKSSGFIGVDTAPMHMAAALDKPVVALFGPSDEKKWAPWGDRSQVIAHSGFSCRSCELDGCGGGKLSECLSSIEADTVFQTINSYLSDREA
ncbi:lipopolysaccharide heptosyltransferase III, putative [Hahella chejuensis KCTC 2396]|uniref:Lipopolysaccharide heptosyltransferase III, putative n=1 Tax=Hahella chejuensis (strain KCTC 2396) TaxID=349521 RepID=Q2SN37_HAHCH|nr:putative lipopolysaccharide heptosyltransferase III [Hahella chejuensis]ABC27937.1 lipopolysaccharide heptosyltransferase III, putative [Hahella chejuensis KCTC 2396]